MCNASSENSLYLITTKTIMNDISSLPFTKRMMCVFLPFMKILLDASSHLGRRFGELL